MVHLVLVQLLSVQIPVHNVDSGIFHHGILGTGDGTNGQYSLVRTCTGGIFPVKYMQYCDQFCEGKYITYSLYKFPNRFTHYEPYNYKLLLLFHAKVFNQYCLTNECHSITCEQNWPHPGQI